VNTRVQFRVVSPRFPSCLKPGCLAVILFLFLVLPRGVIYGQATYPSGPQITKDGTAIALQDYASLPISSLTLSNYPPATNYAGQLSRLNFMHQEPPNAPLSSNRFFVCDLNRNLYILDRASKTFTTYINFEVVFPKFVNNVGYSAGLVTFAFDPDYANNHKFYTVHTENPAIAGSAQPSNTFLPGLNLTGYTTTAVINPPAGTVARQTVLIEWTATSITNTTFQGTARELLRVGYYDIIHPMGDLLFNPLAQPGDSDYENLYIAVGDGGGGEVAGVTHTTPQRLDALQGKVLRITPDITLRPADILSTNGRYRIPSTGPDPNPFISLTLSNVQKEIYAYGFRNIHRLGWDPVSDQLIANVIGLASWEMVDIVHKGSNYGWAEREGTEQVIVSSNANNGLTGSQTKPVTPFPSPDTLTVTGLTNPVTPTYPVAEYSHHDGDAMANGFVYRGSLVPQLAGKYLFGDITTARLLYCNLSEMLAADDGNRLTVAPINELQVVYDGAERRMFDIVANEFTAKGGNAGQALPQGAWNTSGDDPYGVPYGGGRADIRFAEDNSGELYVLSKSDGMIRQITALLSPPTISSATITNTTVTITWPSIVNQTYRLQSVTSLTSTNWTNVPGDISATTTNSSKTDTLGKSTRFYRLILLP
jgi:hypothetical protein